MAGLMRAPPSKSYLRSNQQPASMQIVVNNFAAIPAIRTKVNAFLARNLAVFRQKCAKVTALLCQGCLFHSCETSPLPIGRIDDIPVEGVSRDGESSTAIQAVGMVRSGCDFPKRGGSKPRCCPARPDTQRRPRIQTSRNRFLPRSSQIARLKQIASRPVCPQGSNRGLGATSSIETHVFRGG